MRDALVRARGKVAAVSPIIGNAAVAGPAGILMTAQGLPCSIAGRQGYEDFLDLLICDTRDARAAEALRANGCECSVPNYHASTEDKAALARTVLSFTTDHLVSGQPVSDGADSNKSAARADVEQP